MNNTIPLSSILVEGRLREDLGDVTELAESIRDNGLLQPIVVERISHPTFAYALRCGGRRYAAYTLLATNKVPCDPSLSPTNWESIPAVVFEEMPSYKRTLIEMEENIRRKGMTWQETLRGIVEYHKAAKRAALLDGDTWSQAQTGALLNMSQATVSIAFKVWDEIKAGNEKVMKADSLTDAIKVLAGQQLDAGQAEQMRRIQLKRLEQSAARMVTSSLPTLPTTVVSTAEKEKPATVADKVQFSKEEIAAFYHLGNALEVLPKIAANQLINHIICDPPYGIDMANLTREDMGRFDAIERIADTHQVEDNLKMLPEFLSVAYNSIAEDGFLCMWYDLDHHEKIANWAKQVGWRIQRWPLVWCKTSPCLNNAAQCNITKATEFCYIMRRSEKSIIKTKQAKNFIEAAGCATASHPFPKPHAVWKYLLDTVSMQGQVICDPFAGEGSCLAATFKEGRVPVGIEIDEKHIASGLSYIQDLINKKSILDDILMPPSL